MTTSDTPATDIQYFGNCHFYSNSDTPATDAQVERMTGDLRADQFIPADFARQLERDLLVARDRILTLEAMILNAQAALRAVPATQRRRLADTL